MPKEAFEITKFDKGVVTSPSSRDIMANAAIEAKNIDCLTEQGKLVPIPGETTWFAYSGTEMAELPANNDERDLIIFDNATGNLNHVTDVYEQTGSRSLAGSIGTLSNTSDVTFETHNKEVYIGGRTSTYNVPIVSKMIKYLDSRTQFGANSTTGYTLFDAELYNPDAYLTVSVTESTTNADIEYDEQTYHYGFSVVYDEYQESPLYYDKVGNNVLQHFKSHQHSSTNNPTKGINVQITVDTTDTKFTKRITGIRVYRAISPLSTFLATGYYRLVKEIDVTASTGWTTSGTDKIYTYTDKNDTASQSYDNNTGMPQSLDNFSVDYKLSTKINNSIFVANCYQPDIGLQDSSSYIFKSKAYRPSMFDWANDYLRIEFIPTAITSFLGKLYVFGENRMLKINPNNMIVEDDFEGVGCLNQRSVLVSEYGMLIASDKSIYLHNGNTPAPISDVINEGSTYAWQNRDTTYDSFVLFEPKRNSFLVFFETSSNEQCAWAFNISQQRWDLYTYSNAFKGGYLNRDGEVVVSDSNSLERLFTSGTQKNFEWRSADLNMGSDSQRKIFFKVYVFGTGTIDVQHSVDKASLSSATSVDTSVLTNEANGITLPAGAGRKGKTISVKVSGGNGEKVDSIAIIMRKLSMK